MFIIKVHCPRLAEEANRAAAEEATQYEAVQEGAQQEAETVFKSGSDISVNTTENVVVSIERQEGAEIENPSEKVTVKLSDVNDEICPDDVYQKKRTVCTVNFYPEVPGNKHFSDTLEKYFNESEKVKKVLNCKLDFFGNYCTVKMLMKNGPCWRGYFNDPEKNFPDLLGLRTVRHECQDLSNCDYQES